MRRNLSVQPIRDRYAAAFSLIEILVAIAVLVILIVFATHLTNSASGVARVGVKHMNNDAQARAVLDHIGVDIARMIKRTDLDYYVKQPSGKYNNDHNQGHGWGKKLKTNQQGNDQCAFFALAPGYYPPQSATAPVQQQSPLSLVAYRVNQNSGSANYLQLERMAKGLLWNGVDITTSSNSTYPILFLPGQIDANAAPWTQGWPQWYAAVNNDTNTKSIDSDYEVIGPQVFRLEYWYLLKNGTLTDVPWDVISRPAQATISSPTPIGLTDVQAIGVAIAVIDPASRLLIPSSTLLDIASDLDDFKDTPPKSLGAQKHAGDVEYRWNTVLLGDPNNLAGVPGIVNSGQTSANSKVPPEVAKCIRVYSRYYDLRSQ